MVDWVLHVRVEKKRGLRRHPQRERKETDLDHHERGGDDLEVLSQYHVVRRDDRGHRDQSAELRERLVCTQASFYLILMKLLENRHYQRLMFQRF